MKLNDFKFEQIKSSEIFFLRYVNTIDEYVNMKLRIASINIAYYFFKTHCSPNKMGQTGFICEKSNKEPWPPIQKIGFSRTAADALRAQIEHI